MEPTTRFSSIFDKNSKLENPSAFFGWDYNVSSYKFSELDLIGTEELEEVDSAAGTVHPIMFYAITPKLILRFTVCYK